MLILAIYPFCGIILVTTIDNKKIRMSTTKPFIPATTRLPEITLKAVIVGVLLAIVLAASNAYLALKVGILTSASIPAAILSMGILKLFKQSNILENNIVQTCASTGEAVAGGIVYTIPGLIIIHYWQHFPYWPTFFISCFAGILGVMFSVPIRRILLNDDSLPFPEGKAIAEVLKANHSENRSLKQILIGGTLGAVIEFMQNGLKVLADSMQVWFAKSGVLFGFGSGFSATLIGAGYLIGFNIGLSLLIGAIISWLICVPILSFSHPIAINSSIINSVMSFWGQHIRYIGIGAMITAGLWTLLSLLKSLAININRSLKLFLQQRRELNIARTDQDIPLLYVAMGIVFLLFLFWLLLRQYFPLNALNLNHAQSISLILASLLYILIIGFMICAICGYFSGMVGVSASPGSAAIIAGMLLAAIMIRSLLPFHSTTINFNAAAITIILGAIITGAAAITNDNIQDLKVGQLVGATPWKQQLMLILGVIVGSAVIPPIIEALFNVYGIGDVFPRPGMDHSQVLAAPPAAMLAAISAAVFNHDIPWQMLFIGAAIALLFISLNLILKKSHKNISVLGIATGMYLPLTSSTPLFIGSFISLLVNRKIKQQSGNQATIKQNGLILACGLVAGSALMNVVLAIPYAFAQSPKIFTLMPTNLHGLASLLSIIMTIALCAYIYRATIKG